jgi:hypothetical protein
MSSSPLRSLVKPSCLIMLSIAWGAMATGTNAFADPIVGSQELKTQIERLQANSVTRISCSRDQYNKCVNSCVNSHRQRYGESRLESCKSYCRENASTKSGCE